jgi:hypothetical protein
LPREPAAVPAVVLPADPVFTLSLSRMSPAVIAIFLS